MLKIINDMTPFIEDNYRRISVREYSRLKKISPPTASKLLEYYSKEGLLNKYAERNYIFFYANKENMIFRDISRIYWKIKLSDLIIYLEKNLLMPALILFGSLSKAEAKPDSDIDIAAFTPTKKDVDLASFEKKLKRKIQLFTFTNPNEVDNKELLNNIINGYVLAGELNGF